MNNTFNIPAGWTITIEGDTAQLVAPVEGPGITVVAEQSRRLAERMLFALAKALAAAPPVDAVPGEPVARIECSRCNGAGVLETGIYLPTCPICKGLGSFAASVASRAGSEPVGIVKHLEKIDVVWITHPSSMAENTHLYAIAPAAAAEPSEPKCDPTQTECRRCKNAMANCDGVFAPDRAGVASLVARMTRLKDAIEGECNGLAITDDVAKEIIAYIDTGLPPYLRSAAQAKP